MAMIMCPECGRNISDKAKTCPGCGCPVEEITTVGTVKIKMPNIELGVAGLFSSRRAIVSDSTGNILWEGQHGQTAIFQIEQPTTVTIDLGGWVNNFSGTVFPRKKYNCVQDLGIHWKGTYRLAEVDVIDAD